MIDVNNKHTKIDNIIINQFMGLGDILFSIAIAKRLYDIGYNIIWPVNNSFLTIQKNFEWINFVDKQATNIDYENTSISIFDNNLVLPLRWSNNVFNNGNSTTCMIDKYRILGLSPDLWTTLSWKRDTKKEDELFYEVLGLTDDTKYNVINENFRMFKKVSISCENEYRNIKFEIIDGYNILDWYKVIENATTIHTVGTSIVFMIEVIPTPKLEKYVLYPRIPDEYDCKYYNYLLKKPTHEKTI